MAEENHTIRLLTEMRKDMSEMRKETRDEFTSVREEMRAEFRTARQEREELREQGAALRQRMVEGEVRLSTELLAVSGALDEVKGLLRQQSAIKMVVTDHERRLRKLEGD